MKDGLHRLLYDYLLKTGVSENFAAYVNALLLLVGALILAGVLDYIIWKVLRSVSIKLARKSRNNFDNFLVANRVPRYLAHIIPFFALLQTLIMVRLSCLNCSAYYLLYSPC